MERNLVRRLVSGHAGWFVGHLQRRPAVLGPELFRSDGRERHVGFRVATVPEPSTFILAAIAGGMLLAVRRRSRDDRGVYVATKALRSTPRKPAIASGKSTPWPLADSSSRIQISQSASPPAPRSTRPTRPRSTAKARKATRTIRRLRAMGRRRARCGFRWGEG